MISDCLVTIGIYIFSERNGIAFITLIVWQFSHCIKKIDLGGLKKHSYVMKTSCHIVNAYDIVLPLKMMWNFLQLFHIKYCDTG